MLGSNFGLKIGLLVLVANIRCYVEWVHEMFAVDEDRGHNNDHCRVDF